MHRTRRWAVRLAARLRVEVGVAAGLDSTMDNVSPPAPIRRSPLILIKTGRSCKRKPPKA
jgi:hypothetical protein